MGGSSGGGGSTPPPPKAPPPPAEDITAEVISPTLRQEAARRAKRGAYTTKGQKLGAGGEVLGAGSIELANVADAAGVDMTEKKIERKQYKFKGQSVKLFGRGMATFRGKEMDDLVKRGYKTTDYQVKRKRSAFGGHRTKTFQEIRYDDYVKQYNQRVAEQRSQKRKGLTI